MKKTGPPAGLLESLKPTLVEVQARWSGESHLMDFIISEIEEQFRKKIKVKRIDFDDNKEWLNQLGIKNPPAFLFINGGQVVEVINEILSKKILEKKVNDLLTN